ncbi:MAG: TIGR03618 family F420-dependent PPOX class oxidoreductase [Chloroflexi bacterium]|nr:TIGR03618 family F420-dependent PPOX class oxidoreductase [Chloroflexota bacterium]
MPDKEEFLHEANVAILSTIDKKGRPHALPIWYLYEDGTFILSTGRGAQKHKNVEANPEISLTMDKRTLPYYAVMVRGTAEIGPPLTDEQRLRMANRYLGEDLGRRYYESTEGSDSITIRLKPAKTVVYEGRAGRTIK